MLKTNLEGFTFPHGNYDRIITIDFDDTLVNTSQFSHFAPQDPTHDANWDEWARVSAEGCTLNTDMLDCIKNIYKYNDMSKCALFLVTSRSVAGKHYVEQAMKRLGVHNYFHHIIMRPRDDHSHPAKLKLRQLDTLSVDFTVSCHYDDDPETIELLQSEMYFVNKIGDK